MPVKNIKEPPHLVCYICGLKYGTKSLKFHLVECKSNFSRKEKGRPKWQRIRLSKAPRELVEFHTS